MKNAMPLEEINRLIDFHFRQRLQYGEWTPQNKKFVKTLRAMRKRRLRNVAITV